MEESRKITVVTVAYNAIEDLKRTMQSVDAQDYPNIEYIIVDGGSTDGTPQYLASYSGKLTRWVSERDRGIYDAMNKAVAMATGDYCIFMNAGDTFADSHVVTAAVEQMGDADVAYGDILKRGEVVKAKEPCNCHKMYYCHQAAFVKTECLRQFPFDISHKMSADFKQAKQMTLAGKSFRHMPLVVAEFDTHGISNTRRSKGLMDNIKVINEVDGFAYKCRLLPRLLFTYFWCKVRGK